MSDSDAERAAPAASLFATPRGGTRQRVMAALQQPVDDRAESDPDIDDGSLAPADADSVLYSKGDASASGFRPWYWSYESEGSAPSRGDAERSSADRAVASPGPAAAPAASGIGATKLAPAVVSGLCTLALVGAVTLLVLSRAEAPPGAGASPAAVMARALPMAPPPPAPPKPTRVAALPAPAHAAAATAASAAELAELMARGSQMFATGDIAAARLFFERAAESGSAAAAREAGKTYDPLALADAHARGIRGDPVAAARWYRKASEGGDKAADLLMKRLMAKYAG